MNADDADLRWARKAGAELRAYAERLTEEQKRDYVLGLAFDHDGAVMTKRADLLDELERIAWTPAEAKLALEQAMEWEAACAMHFLNRAKFLLRCSRSSRLKNESSFHAEG